MAYLKGIKVPRLTKREDGTWVETHEYDATAKQFANGYKFRNSYQHCLNKLAEYENLGTVEELSEMKVNFEKAIDLLEKCKEELESCYHSDWEWSMEDGFQKVIRNKRR